MEAVVEAGVPYWFQVVHNPDMELFDRSTELTATETMLEVLVEVVVEAVVTAVSIVDNVATSVVK
jgi:hypothetical protein